MLFDSSSNQIYIPRTGRIEVVDPESGKVNGEVTGFGDARRVALDDSGRYGYVADIMDGAAGYVRVFDRKTFAMVSTIEVGRIPVAIIFDPTTRTVFSFSSRDKSTSVIDTASNAVIATLPLPGKPHLAVTDGKGAIYLSFRGIGEIARIDAASRKITATWSTAPCVEFTGMAIDEANRQLLGTCADGKMIAIGMDSGQVVSLGECPIDATDLVFDSQRRLLISASSSGVLTTYRQVSPTHYTHQEELPTQPRAGTIVEDPGKGRIYLATAKFGQRPVSGKGMEELQSRLMPVAGSFEVIVVSR